MPKPYGKSEMQPKTLIAIFLAGLSVFLAADAKNEYQELAGRPYFDQQGCLRTLSLDFQGWISGWKAYSDNSVPGLLRQGKYNQRIINSPSGFPWFTGVSLCRTGTDILAGKIINNKIKDPSCISNAFSGINISPDLTFAFNDHPWISWINKSKGNWRLLVQNSATSQTWEILVSSSPVFTPKIAADRNGRIWVFWTWNRLGADQIFVSYYENGAWSQPENLTSNPAVPHFHPAVTLNALGYPLLVWSSFNGNGYSLCSSEWTGENWSMLPPVSRLSDSSDGEAEAVLLEHTIPLIVWTRSSQSGSQIFLSYWTGTRWAAPVNLTPEKHSACHPLLTSYEDKAAVIWEDEEGLSLETFSFSQVLEKLPFSDIFFPPAETSFLMDDKFVAFGDSITYGSSNGAGMNEEGYPPRLQTLLEQIFFNPSVVNKGLPGEPTWKALGRIKSVLIHEMALYLLLMEGTNDVTNLTYSLDTTIFNLEQVVIQAENYGVTPLISSIIPRARSRWTPGARSRTLELNEKIIQMAENLKLVFVDNYSAFMQYPADEGGHGALISDDNLHPNGSGYQVMAETWYNSIRFLPFPPINVTALRMYREEQVRLTWDINPKNHPDAGIVHYRVLRRKQGSSQEFRPIGIALASQNEFIDTSINPDSKYLYALRAKNIEGVEGPMSSPVSPARGDPYPPVNIFYQTVINRAFLYHEVLNHVTWEDNPQNNSLFSIIKYRIYRKMKNEEDDLFTLIGEVDGNTAVYLDRQISSEKTAEDYIYGISAVNQNNIEGIIGKNSEG